jgi:hypothetical protein
LALSSSIDTRREKHLTCFSSRAIDFGATIRIVEGLVAGMEAIHAAGIFHGDINAKNILIRQADSGVRFLDIFDVAEVGDGRVRTPSICPPSWENLTEQQIDNYSLIRLVLDLIESNGDVRFSSFLEILKFELLRPVINTLDPVSTALRQTIETVFAVSKAKSPTDLSRS